jgi:H+/gluconate symporter-like permease
MNNKMSQIKDIVLSSDPINETPVVGTVKSYVTDALRPKSKEYAAYSFHRNLMGLKIIFLVLVLLAAIFNQLILYRKQSGKTSVLKKPLFWVECFVVGLSMTIPTILLLVLRDKHMVVNDQIDWKSIIIKGVVVGVVFFIANILFELSGLYSSFYEKENEKENKKEEDTKTPNERAKTSFTNALLILAGLVVLVVLVNMVWCTIVARDTSTNYNFGFDSHKWVVFIIEMLIFAVIGAIPLYLIAQNRSGKVTGHTTLEVFIFCAKFIFLFLGLQLSGTFTYWFDK